MSDAEHLWFEDDDGKPWFYIGDRDYYIKHRMTPDKAERWAAILTAFAASRPVPARPTGEEGQPFRLYWHRKHAVATAGSTLRGDGSDGAWLIGPISAERTITLTSAHVATLPNGSRVELPAGTVLREGTGGLDPAHLLACARGVVDHDATQPLNGPVAHALLSALREACGDTLEDVGARIAAEPRRRSLLGVAPCTGKRPANAGATGIECDDPACPRHGVIPPPARPTTCRHGTQSHYIKDGALGCEDCDAAAKDAARIAAQEGAARDAARLGKPVYDRASGRISFKPVEVVEAPPIPIAEAYRLGMHVTPEPIHEPKRKPTVGPLMFNGAPVAEVESVTFDRTVKPEHIPPKPLEDGAIFRTIEVDSVLNLDGGAPPSNAPPAPDPWLHGLTLATANAVRSGIERGIGAKAGVAAVAAAFQAGVDMALNPLLPKP